MRLTANERLRVGAAALLGVGLAILADRVALPVLGPLRWTAILVTAMAFPLMEWLRVRDLRDRAKAEGTKRDAVPGHSQRAPARPSID